MSLPLHTIIFCLPCLNLVLLGSLLFTGFPNSYTSNTASAHLLPQQSPWQHPSAPLWLQAALFLLQKAQPCPPPQLKRRVLLGHRRGKCPMRTMKRGCVLHRRGRAMQMGWRRAVQGRWDTHLNGLITTRLAHGAVQQALQLVLLD